MKLALVSMAFMLAVAPAAAAEVRFTDFVTYDTAADVATGTLNGTSVRVSGPVLQPTHDATDDNSIVFALSHFTPALPTSDIVYPESNLAGRTFTIAFGRPVADPTLHLASLGSRLTFADVAEIRKVSGQPGLTVSGNVVTGAYGADPEPHNDVNGTVQLAGTYASLTFTAVDVAHNSMDGFGMQVGEEVAPPPVTGIAVGGEQAPEGYFRGGAFVRVTATDAAETRCVLDPPSAPASFGDLPAHCPYTAPFSAVLADGEHVVYAASRNRQGATEALVERRFRVEVPPETTITSAPQGMVWLRDPEVAFTSDQPGASFECRVGGAPFAPCTSPHRPDVGTGRLQTFEVRARDADGVYDATPAQAEFGVNDGLGAQLECRYNPLPPHLGGPLRNEVTQCFSGGDGAYECLRFSRCALAPTARCPAGAYCTLNIRLSMTTHDLGVRWTASGVAAFGSTLAAKQSTLRRTWCTIVNDKSFCSASTDTEALGTGQPALINCSHEGFASRDPRWPALFRDDKYRRLTCTGELIARPAPALRPIPLPGPFVSIWIPAPGRVTMAATPARGKRAVVARPRFKPVTRQVTEPGPVSANLKPNRAARRQLRRKGRLRVALKTTFTPAAGGAPTVTDRVLTLRPPSRAG